MADLKLVRPSTEAERTTRTTTDTLEITPKIVSSWKLPPFQRELRINDRVRALANDIREDGGVIPGVITLGVLDGQRYLIDGQHRREAFIISECIVGYCDVRILYFDTLAEMGEEFVQINSRLVTMKPDDILKGLEGTNAAIAKVRRRCPFVGYGQIRRGDKSPILSMSAAIRCWFGSAPDVPKAGGLAAMDLVKTFTTDDAEQLTEFLDIALAAWGKDPEYSRLWLGLNMTLSMWLYRRLVIAPYSAKTPRLTKEQFTKVMMGLSADSTYLEWLIGRQLRETDRSPCYNRIKKIFAERYEGMTGKKALLPQPPWASSVRGSGTGVPR